MRQFNINNEIKVKLTEDGIAHLNKMWKRQYHKMDGEFHVFLLWEFMQLFGEECYMGQTKQFFEQNRIVIPDIADSIEGSAYRHMIGQKVNKPKSKNPFKSKLLINTVKGITVNPNTGRPGFTFEEDESIVDCYQCGLIE